MLLQKAERTHYQNKQVKEMESNISTMLGISNGSVTLLRLPLGAMLREGLYNYWHCAGKW